MNMDTTPLFKKLYLGYLGTNHGTAGGSLGHRVYGLTEEGAVYEWSKDHWKRLKNTITEEDESALELLKAKEKPE